MTILLSGGAKCGKSSLAQDLTAALANDSKRYYVATLIPSGEEDHRRIRDHLADRDGMGFETVECFAYMLDCLKTTETNGAFLVDSVTSLLQNALFPAERNYEMDLDGARRCCQELEAFAGTVRHAVFVSDDIYCDARHYSDTTETYRRCLAEIDRRLAAICDVVIEVSAGQTIIHKGELCL